MSDVGESRWFKISLFVFSTVVTVVAAFNVWAIYKLRAAVKTAGTSGINVTTGETDFLLVANIILLIFSLTLLIYSIWKLTVSKKSRQVIGNRVYRTVTTDQDGFDIVTETPVPVVEKEEPAQVRRVRYATRSDLPATGARARTTGFSELPVTVSRRPIGVNTTRSVIVEE